MQKLRKLTCLLLCLLLLVGVVSIAAFACDCDKTPIIYIKGRTNIYKTTDDNSDANKAETNLSGGTGSVVEAVAHVLPYLGTALMTDKWDAYADVLYDEIIPLYDKYHLNDDGEIDNDSGIYEFWSPENMIARVKAAGETAHRRNYGDITNTQFQYDMRLDPCVIAGQLWQFVEAVKEVSGHSKVNIVARCEGTVIANAYFNLFGYDDIDKVVIYNPISADAEIADDVFSNKVMMDADALNRFIDQFIDSTPIIDLIKATLNAWTYSGRTERITTSLEYIYGKVSPILMPRLIRDTFGTCPGWWGMVSPEHLEECKDFVLDGNRDGRYTKLIEKIDSYNDTCKVNARGILEEMEQNGVKVYLFVKYGSQMYPVIEHYDTLGDGVVSIYKQTFCGATASLLTDTLSDEYVAARTAAGFGKYISADHMVDASTAPLCTHTWYFKELAHDNYPNVLHTLMFRLFGYDGYATVDTFEDMPQFFLYKGSRKTSGTAAESLSPLTDENKEESNITVDTSSFFVVTQRVFRALFAYIKSLFQK